MKKIIILVLAIFCLTPLAFAQKALEVNQESGKVRLVEESPDWRPATKEERQAYQNPGSKVPIGEYSLKTKKIDLFHYSHSKEWNKAVVFRDNRMEKVEYETGKLVEQAGETFAWHKIMLTISVVLMILAGFLSRKKRFRHVVVGLFFLIVVISTFSAFILTPKVTTLPVTIATFIAFFAITIAGWIFVILERRTVIDKIFVAIFYIACGISILL